MSLDIEALYISHCRKLRGFVAQRMAGASDAEVDDMVSDVFERAIRAAPRYQDRGRHPSALLYQIARNLLIDHYRHRAVVAIVRLGDLKPYVEHVGTSDHLERLDAKDAVHRAFAIFRTGHQGGLSPEKQLAVLRARFFEGGTDAEVGARLGLSEMATKKLRGRAIVNMKRALEVA